MGKVATLKKVPGGAASARLQDNTELYLDRPTPVEGDDTLAAIDAANEQDGFEIEVVDGSKSTKVDDLKAEAKELGIDVPSGAKKADIEQLIANKKANPDS